LKAQSPILVTLSGIISSLRDLQWANIPVDITLLYPEGADGSEVNAFDNFTDLKFVQPLNAPPPMLVTVLGISIDSNE
jgi:hypothetical protein